MIEIDQKGKKGGFCDQIEIIGWRRAERSRGRESKERGERREKRREKKGWDSLLGFCLYLMWILWG